MSSRPAIALALAAVVWTTLAVAAGPATRPAAAPAPSVREGVYTAEQAKAGARTYAIRCAVCHGSRLEGSYEVPALTGKFVAHWARRPVWPLFDYVSRAMPQPAPGSLSPTENAALIAFLLEANGLPAGERPLPSDQAGLSAIAFDGPGAGAASR